MKENEKKRWTVHMCRKENLQGIHRLIKGKYTTFISAQFILIRVNIPYKRIEKEKRKRKIPED